MKYQLLVSGALAMGYAVAALFFFQFWKQTTDRLFAFFSASFAILALQRVALAMMEDVEGSSVWIYGLRLVSFLLILAAILEKNRARPNV